MWDRLEASIPAVAWKQVASATTRAGFVQTGAGVGAAVGVGDETATGLATGVCVAIAVALGDAAADPVEACGLAVHAAIASDVDINVSRTSGPVLIP
jgi:hypothetical protein